MSTSSPSRRAAESGFTLIEMIITLVILSIVVAVASGTLVSGANGERRTSEKRRASGTMTSALARLRTDLELARSPGRLGLTREQLAAALRAPLPGPDDVRDVLVAEPFRLTFRAALANEDAATGTDPAQCVTWAVDGEGWLTRTVQSGVATGGVLGWQASRTGDTAGARSTTCLGPTLGTERFVPVLQDQPIFRYTELRNPDLTADADLARCQRTSMPARTTYDGRASAAATERVAPINRITSIDVELRVRYDDRAGGAGPTTARRTSATLVGRTGSSTYLEVLGCA